MPNASCRRRGSLAGIGTLDASGDRERERLAVRVLGGARGVSSVSEPEAFREQVDQSLYASVVAETWVVLESYSDSDEIRLMYAGVEVMIKSMVV